MIRQFAKSVVVGTPEIYTLPGFFEGGMTVGVDPGVAGSVLVEYRLHTSQAWRAWPAGTVTTYTEYVILSRLQALRFTATTSNGNVYITQ